MRAVIDTCVIVDALQSREPFCKDAQSIFLLCANRQFEGFLTAKAITDIYYLTHRQTHSDKATRDVLTKLCALFGLLDTTALDIRKAISAEISDFEDAVMVETAVRSGVERTHILDGRIPHSILIELLSDEGIGTMLH